MDDGVDRNLLLFFFLLNTFQILQITAIENEINNRTVPAPFVKFVGQPNTEISSQAMTAITWTQKNAINQIQ